MKGMAMTTPEPAFAPNQWAFDERVTEQFDQMLSRSIPHYALMRQCCYGLGKQFVQRGTDVVDIGCSRGEAIQPFIDDFGATIRYALIEASTPMVETVRARYKTWTDSNLMRIYHADLKEFYPNVQASLTLSVLTLMFIPIEYRHTLLRKIFNSTNTGGAFILVEKILGNSAALNDSFCNSYHALKLSHGYSTEEVERKKLALEGRLVPITAAWNEELLHGAGFSQVDCFWRWMNFAAWIAIKD